MHSGARPRPARLPRARVHADGDAALRAGPRIVNNVVINRNTTVNVTNITVYRNVQVNNAVVGVPRGQFGQAHAHPSQIDLRQLAPVHGSLEIKPVAASVMPATGATVKPPAPIHERGVVATRPPHEPHEYRARERPSLDPCSRPRSGAANRPSAKADAAAAERDQYAETSADGTRPGDGTTSARFPLRATVPTTRRETCRSGRWCRHQVRRKCRRPRAPAIAPTGRGTSGAP